MHTGSIQENSISPIYSEALPRFLTHKKTEGKRLDTYRHLSSVWLELYGNKPLAEITTEEIERDILSLREKHHWSPATRDLALRQLSSFFTYAYRRGWINVHPIKGRLAYLNPDNARERYLTKEECDKLVTNSPPWLADIITVAVRTGLRLDEVCRLTEASVDVVRNVLILTKTKNGKPHRVPLTGTVERIVMRRYRFAKRLGGYLFTGPRGGNVKSSIRRHLPKAVKAAGMKWGRKYDDGVTFHTFRHTFASQSIQSGLSTEIVKKLGNWQSDSMVSRYTHLADDARKNALNHLDRFLD